MEKIKKFLFINTSTKQTVIKNTFWLFFGEIIGRILKLVIVVFSTRKLGVEGWGLFSYAMAFISLFFILGDFGINTFITKEMSKDNNNKHKYLATSIIIRLFMIAVFCSTALLLAPNLGKIKLGFGIVFIFTLFFVSESLREIAMSINRSLEKMEVEGFSKILINLSITVFGLILLINNVDPISLAMAYMIGSIISTIYIVWSIRKELKGIEWKFSKENWKVIYQFSWPIVIMSFFGFLFSLDTIMLGQMKSAVDVGLYTMAQRLISVFSIIPGFIGASLFPILSRNENDNNKLGYIFEKIMTIILALGIPITIIGVFFSKEIILLIVGPAYIAGASVLGVLMISILASFPNIFLTNLIFSKNLQKIFITATISGVLLNILLNFWLIPKYGALGAAISTTIAELLIMVTNWKRLKKIIPFSVIPKLGKIALSNMVMLIIIIVLHLIGLNFIIITFIAIVTYILILNMLEESNFKEIYSLVKNH
ncbi:MAG: flippase [Candidatus Nomurabacteria bacterium]|nr:flippase [Candidatus Nomurabacteria bacterium]